MRIIYVDKNCAELGIHGTTGKIRKCYPLSNSKIKKSVWRSINRLP